MDQISRLYVFLCALFCVIVVIGNVIFQKFVLLTVANFSVELSVGIFLYPITFLISDVITEFYGKKAARFVVRVSIIVSILIMCLLHVSDLLPATTWSMVDDEMFHKVFGVYGVGATASLVAVYVSQTLDILVFARLKAVTNGRHLWLRNNFSIITGQIIDTACVLTIMCSFGVVPWDKFSVIAYSSLSFKIFAALFGTPFFYLVCYWIGKYKKPYKIE